MNNLRFTFPVDIDAPFVKDFQRSAERNCLGVIRCINDTRVVLLSNIPFNYPFVAAVSHWLTSAVANTPFLDATLKAIVGASIIGTLSAILIGFIWLSRIPRHIAGPVGLAIICFALLPMMDSVGSNKFPEPLLHPLFFSHYNSGAGLALAVLIVIALMLTARWISFGPFYLRIRHWMLRPTMEQWSWVTVALLGTLLVIRLLDITGTIVLLVTGATGVLLLSAMALRLQIPAITAFVLAFVVAVSVNKAYFYFSATVPSPLGSMALGASAWLVMASVIPKSRWVLLMPALLVFHLAAAGLFACAVLASEIILCLWRRRPSKILLISAVTAALSVILSTQGQTGALVGESSDNVLPALLQAIATEPLEGAARIIPFLVAAIYLTWRGQGRLDASARAAIMCGALASWLHISAGLIRIGINPIDPTFHIYIYIFSYLGPCLGIAIPLVILADLLQYSHTSKTSDNQLVSRKFIISCSLLFIIMSRGDYYLQYVNGPVTALRQGWSLVTATDDWTARDPALHCLDFADESYFLRISPEQRPNDALTYASYLKYVLRKEAARFDPSAARIITSDGRDGYPWHTIQSQVIRKTEFRPLPCPKVDGQRNRANYEATPTGTQLRR
jgi:hypothetical protein